MSKDFNGGYQITLPDGTQAFVPGEYVSNENPNSIFVTGTCSTDTRRPGKTKKRKILKITIFPRLPNTRAHVSRPLLRLGSSARRTKRRCSGFYSPELYSSPVPITPGR